MEKIGANIFVETVYPGVNVGCVITDEGAICVDTPLLPGEAQRWRERIRILGAEQVCFVVYTSGQRERVLGTQYLLSGSQVSDIPRPPLTRPFMRLRPDPFPRVDMPPMVIQGRDVRRGAVLAHELVWEQVKDHATDNFRQSMVDMFGDRDPDMVDLEVILPQITFADSSTLFVGDLTVKLLAVASGISLVWLPDQSVLFTGDSVVVGTHPPLTTIDVREWLMVLEQMRQNPQYKDTVVVPGRGPLCDISVVEPLMEYLRLVRDKTWRIYQSGGTKAELNEVAVELLPLFPVVDGQRERVQRQIKLGLDELYDGFKAASTSLDASF